MKFLPHKTIANILLTVLIWSCFGLGLGMIGQSFVSSGHEHHVSSSMECCSADTTNSATEPGTMNDHHAVNSVILVSTKLFAVVLLALFLAVGLTIRHENRPSIFFYFQRWRDRWKFFALYLSRLFSAGILHPKTW